VTGQTADLPGPPRPAPAPELMKEITRLALASNCRSQFRSSALLALGGMVPFDRGCWEEFPPSGSLRVVVAGPLSRALRPLAVGAAPAGLLRLELERFGKVRATLILELDERAFLDEEVAVLEVLLPTLILADEGAEAAAPAGPARTLSPREAEIVEYVRLGYTNAQIALATGRSLAAVRNLLVRIFDKTGVRSRAQLVNGPLTTSGLTRRERQIVEHLRAGLTNREIGRTLGISANTVRNTLARLFEKVGVSTRSELMGALAEPVPSPDRSPRAGTVW
jgi:DNA-binding CsgD family transcriptional regulator